MRAENIYYSKIVLIYLCKCFVNASKQGLGLLAISVQFESSGETAEDLTDGVDWVHGCSGDRVILYRCRDDVGPMERNFIHNIF